MSSDRCERCRTCVTWSHLLRTRDDQCSGITGVSVIMTRDETICYQTLSPVHEYTGVHWVTINTGQWSQACAWTPLVSCAHQLHPQIQCKECWVWTILSRAGCGHWSWYRHRKEEQTSQCSVVGVDADMITYWRVMIQLFRAASNGHQHLFSIVLSPFIALC